MLLREKLISEINTLPVTDLIVIQQVIFAHGYSVIIRHSSLCQACPQQKNTLTRVRVIWCPRGDSNPHDRSR